MMKKVLPYLLIISFAFLLYSPIIFRPELLIGRNNDLSEFFGSIFQFIKNQIGLTKGLPFWNNLFLAGTPLLPDPQSQLFYLPNIIFIFLPIGTGFLVSFLLHLIWAGLGAYLAAKKLFKSKFSFYLASFTYMASSLFWGSLEAGHFGLFNSYSWLPWALLALVSNSFILLGISLAMIFFSHPLIFFLTIGLLFFSIVLFKAPRLTILKGIVLSLGLTAVTLIPQLKWLPLTTRNLLLQIPDVYPKWHSVKEFVIAIVLPNLSGEKRLFLGISILILSTFGFWKLLKKAKIALFILLFGAVLVSLNNASPIINILLKQENYVLLRVATRVWFFVPLLASFLAAYGFEKLFESQKKNFFKYLAFLIVVLEVFLVFWKGINTEIKTGDYAPKSVYEFLANDRGHFRVFCTTRCLSQKDSAKFNLELLDGYATLIQTNFYQHSWELTNSYWNYYSLSVPPIGTYEFEELQPKAESLAEYNVKYVISPRTLTDKNFRLLKELDGYLIFENRLNLSRAYYIDENQKPLGEAELAYFSPNLITVNTKGNLSNNLVLAEVFSPGWKAYQNGKKEIPVLERPNSLRFVNFYEETDHVDFRYDPPGYKTGKVVTLLSILAILIFLLNKRPVFIFARKVLKRMTGES